MVCRLYPAEPLQIAPPEVRGMLGSLNQLTICIGILGALVVNVVLPPDAWRVMFWLATIPAALLAFGGDTTQLLITVSRCPPS